MLACDPAHPSKDDIMTRQLGNQAFSQAEQFLKDVRLPENVQAIAQQGVAKTHEFYTKSAATAQARR